MSCRRFALLSCALGVLQLVPAAGAAQRADTARALHLLSRATFGVRPADLELLLARGERAWLEAQLAPSADPALAEVAERYPTTVLSMAALLRDYGPQPAAAPPARPDSAGTPARRVGQATGPQRLLLELASARLYRAVTSERQLEEVMTQFWFNHFNVFAGKGLDRYFIADYERTAIRPHVFGRFDEMLLAVAQHPAMLFYLDNWQSVWVDSARARRRLADDNARPRGLNENYARELLELHTLGVDGGYTQEDVIAVARAFTGWMFVAPRPGGDPRIRQVRFLFRRELHDPGAKVVLGKPLPGGENDGREVLRLVAAHPSTAKFIAHKLVERFVTDAGDPALEAELAAVFTRTEGDLGQVTRALFTSPRFHAPGHRGAKLKTPFELVASALRVTDSEPALSRRLLQTLRAMGEAPYLAAEPTGYPAASEEWVNSAAMLARMNFGLELAAGRMDGVRRAPPERRRPAAAGEGIATLAALVLPGRETQALQERIAADLAAQADAPPRARLARALGLLLGSPDFQKR